MHSQVYWCSILLRLVLFALSLQPILIRLNYGDSMIGADPNIFLGVDQQCRPQDSDIFVVVDKLEGSKNIEKKFEGFLISKDFEQKKRCCGDAGHFPPQIHHLCNLLVAVLDR